MNASVIYFLECFAYEQWKLKTKANMQLRNIKIIENTKSCRERYKTEERGGKKIERGRKRKNIKEKKN